MSAEIPFDDHPVIQNGPPSGWYHFGTHAGWDSEDIPMLEFSQERDEGGLPLWERVVPHDDSRLRQSLKDALRESEMRRKALFDTLLKVRTLETELEELRAPVDVIHLSPDLPKAPF